MKAVEYGVLFRLSECLFGLAEEMLGLLLSGDPRSF